MKRLIAGMCFISMLVFIPLSASANLVNMNSDASYLLSSPGVTVFNTESMTTFTVTTTVTNETGFTWTGYVLTLNPSENAVFIPNTGGSTRFLTIEYPDDWTINYSAPNTVAPGSVVTFQVDIGIPDTAPITYTITHNPIPEPATAALLVLGSTVLLTVRRKSKK